ncbi:MAG: DUF2892 domain-containing protein [Thermoleophilia bacterium]|nr:DUF2892 domain-containing protein [Thermoleophilia bacterium]
MGCNEHRIDRIVRMAILAPLFLLIGGLFLEGAAAAVFFVLAALMLVTGAIGFCPLYRVFGLNMCERETT